MASLHARSGSHRSSGLSTTCRWFTRLLWSFDKAKLVRIKKMASRHMVVGSHVVGGFSAKLHWFTNEEWLFSIASRGSPSYTITETKKEARFLMNRASKGRLDAALHQLRNQSVCGLSAPRRWTTKQLQDSHTRSMTQGHVESLSLG